MKNNYGKIEVEKRVVELSSGLLIKVIASLKILHHSLDDFDKKALLESDIDCLKRVYLNMALDIDNEEKVADSAYLEAQNAK